MTQHAETRKTRTTEFDDATSNYQLRQTHNTPRNGTSGRLVERAATEIVPLNPTSTRGGLTQKSVAAGIKGLTPALGT